MRSATRALLWLALPALAGCAALEVQVGSRATPETPPIPEAAGPAQPAASLEAAPSSPDKKPRDEESAIQSALRFVESRQHSYTISPADLIEIKIYQESELDRQVRVSPDGVVTFPLVGQVKVSGLGVPAAEEALRERLKRFLIDPQVSIFIKEYGNKQVYVLGEVARPGSYPLPTEAPLTVIEAVTLAGGFTQYAAVDRTRVIRKDQGESRNFQIQISAIMKGDKSKDLQLVTNDVIYVPESFF